MIFVQFSVDIPILLISNGVFIGLTVSEKLSSGMSILEIIIKILPHGIFEIPAIIASGVIGLKSMKLLIRVLSSQKKFSEEFVIMVKDIFVLLIVVIFLTIIASIIEIYITP
ncbi:stage II sporulation protein M [Priestia flexa]|uniref:stage II sporulation protein M n=1 Tax=Priestia flexa TaxID=86664 RepID=UPI003CD0D39A